MMCNGYTMKRCDQWRCEWSKPSSAATASFCAPGSGYHASRLRVCADFAAGDVGHVGVERRGGFAARLGKVVLDFHATLNEPAALEDFAGMPVPAAAPEYVGTGLPPHNGSLGTRLGFGAVELFANAQWAAGHVVTNFHVIQGASEATVRLADGRDYKAGLVGVG